MNRYLLNTMVLVLLVAPLAPAASDAPKSGFRAEFLGQLDGVEKKLVSLAEAFPQEKLTWRPAEGVRSVSEAFLHEASGNYFLLRFLQVQPPEGVDMRNLEKSTTEKAKIVAALKQSFEQVRQAVLNLPDADLDKPTKAFGRETTVRNILLGMAGHQHEHLGQLIAYARTNGVVPPWSAKE